MQSSPSENPRYPQPLALTSTGRPNPAPAMKAVQLGDLVRLQQVGISGGGRHGDYKSYIGMVGEVLDIVDGQAIVLLVHHDPLSSDKAARHPQVVSVPLANVSHLPENEARTETQTYGNWVGQAKAALQRSGYVL